MNLSGKIIITSLLYVKSSSNYFLNAQTDINELQGVEINKLETSHTEIFILNASVERVYDFIAAEDVLSKILAKYFIIPAVKDSKVNQGDWATQGSVRTVFFTNGDTLKEELIKFDRPKYISSKSSEFTGIQRIFASYGICQWWFTSNGFKTEVKWSYTLYAKSKFKKIILKSFVNHDFRTYMQRAIALIKKNIENEK